MFQNINDSTIDSQNYKESKNEKKENRIICKCIANKKYTNIYNSVYDINGRYNRRYFTI